MIDSWPRLKLAFVANRSSILELKCLWALNANLCQTQMRSRVLIFAYKITTFQSVFRKVVFPVVFSMLALVFRVAHSQVCYN